jgi:hypothetical protein
MLKYGESMRNMHEGMTGKMEEGNLKDNDTLTVDKIKSSVKFKDEVEDIPDIMPAKTNDNTSETKETTDDKQKIKKAMNNMTPGMDKETQAEYKNLLELQLKLIDGISNMQPVLSEVAQKIDSMKKTMKS